MQKLITVPPQKRKLQGYSYYDRTDGVYPPGGVGNGGPCYTSALGRTTWTFFRYADALAQGAGPGLRDGREVHAESLELIGLFYYASSGAATDPLTYHDLCRLVVCVAIHPLGGSAADVFEYNSSSTCPLVLSPYNTANVEPVGNVIKILADEMYVLTHEVTMQPFHLRIPLDYDTKYPDTSGFAEPCCRTIYILAAPYNPVYTYPNQPVVQLDIVSRFIYKE